MKSVPKRLRLALVLLVLAVFAETVVERETWKFHPISQHHEFITMHTVFVVKNWLKNGFFNEYGLSFENPRSIETPDTPSRGIYVSYPMGAMVPVFALARLWGAPQHVPTITRLVSLANHLFVALALLLGSWWAAEGEVLWLRALCSSLTPVLFLQLAGPWWWFDRAWFPDIAVILPFVLATILEMRLRQRPESRVRKLLPGVVAWGFYTEWLFVFLAAVAIGWRWIERRREGLRGVVREWFVPASMALGLFAIQLLAAGGFGIFGKLFRKAVWRMGGGTAPGEFRFLRDFGKQFWVDRFNYNYGSNARLFLFAGVGIAVLLFLSYLRNRKKIDATPELHWLGLLTLTSLVQIYVFRQHSAIHDYASLKFAPVLVVLAGTTLPLVFARALPAFRPVAGLALLALAVIPFQRENYLLLRFYEDPARQKFAEVVGRTADYRDVVFSPDFAIEDVVTLEREPGDYALIGLSMKRVRRFTGFDQMERALNKMPDSNPVLYFSSRGPDYCFEPQWLDQDWKLCSLDQMETYRKLRH